MKLGAIVGWLIVVLVLPWSAKAFSVRPKSSSDLVQGLPGLPANATFQQYAGYLNLSSTRHTFYWLVESQSDPLNDPLVLWLNGGPGCSSLTGLLTENGPFFVNNDGRTLSTNPNGWNSQANVLYLEAPFGVGFSYSDSPDDYLASDNSTARYLYDALLTFVDLYPQYVNRSFYITGESYAGHYIPDLATLILQMNSRLGAMDPHVLRLNGFMIGNPWTNVNYEESGVISFWFSRSLISFSTYDHLIEHCGFMPFGSFAKQRQSSPNANPEDDMFWCEYYLNLGFLEVGMVDPYNVDKDLCQLGSDMMSALPHVDAWQQWAKVAPATTLAAKYAQHRLNSVPKRSGWKKQEIALSTLSDPCIGSFLSSYLNDASVQAVLHVRPTRWSACSHVNYDVVDIVSDMLPVYKSLFTLAPNLPMVIFSGDRDSVVPTLGTVAWLSALQLNETRPWEPWMMNGQPAGHTISYGQMSFVSVHNAGHMVPRDQGARALAILSSLLGKVTLSEIE